MSIIMDGKGPCGGCRDVNENAIGIDERSQGGGSHFLRLGVRKIQHLHQEDILNVISHGHLPKLVE
jgi:hypothetical protein